ncbi:MAG: HAMP domain-containing sensor histidine kinase [Bacteroidota bacterium]
MKHLIGCVFLFILLSPPELTGQENAKIPEQQLMLLSKQRQAQLTSQQEQQLLMEKQKKQLIEQEKTLLKFKLEKKQEEFESEKKRDSALRERHRLQAMYSVAIKDKEIIRQNTALEFTKKWIFYLLALFALAMVLAFITWRNHQKTKRLNKIILLQHDKLEQVSKVKDLLLTVVGHDMQSPLNMLMSFAQVLKYGDIPHDKMGVYMDQLESTLIQTSSLIENLLYWARSQMQGYKPAITKTDISQIAAEITSQIQIRADEKNVYLTNDILLNTVVLCDPSMLTLVLRNLTNNAIKFTQAGGAVLLSAIVRDDKVIISVSDNGSGMSGHQEELFNSTSFESVESSLGTANEKGTGLGLLLCKTFTQLMNGHISVRQNINNAGSVFEIVLPNGKAVQA